jgi:hypothetical protein
MPCRGEVPLKWQFEVQASVAPRENYLPGQQYLSPYLLFTRLTGLDKMPILTTQSQIISIVISYTCSQGKIGTGLPCGACCNRVNCEATELTTAFFIVATPVPSLSTRLTQPARFCICFKCINQAVDQSTINNVNKLLSSPLPICNHCNLGFIIDSFS